MSGRQRPILITMCDQALVIYPQGELTGPALPDQITAYLNVEPHEALALMGLVEIENDVTP